MAALDGAITLEKVNNVTQFISQYLYLDMPGAVDTGFEENIRTAECFYCLREHAIIVAPEFELTVAAANASAATTGGRLEHHRITDIGRQHDRLFNAGEAGIAPGNNRHTCVDHAAAGLDLVAHFPNDARIRPNEFDTAAGADFCERRVFGQEAIAGMERVTAGSDRQINDAVGVQVAGHRVRADIMRFVGLADMQGMPVGVGVDCHRFDTCLLAGANDANGNFTAVGYQDLVYQVSPDLKRQLACGNSHFCRKSLFFYANMTGVSTPLWLARQPLTCWLFSILALTAPSSNRYYSRLMLDCLPEHIEPIGLADAGRAFRGELAVSGFHRLAELLADRNGNLQVQIELRRDERCIRVLQGQVEGLIRLTCQRCLEPMEYALDLSFTLGIVGAEDEIEQLPEGYEPLLADGEPLLTAAVIEDEILLAVPAVPFTGSASGAIPGYRNRPMPGRDNPFAVLEKLKH